MAKIVIEVPEGVFHLPARVGDILEFFIDLDDVVLPGDELVCSSFVDVDVCKSDSDSESKLSKSD